MWRSHYTVKTSDLNLDCVHVKNTLFTMILEFKKSNKIECRVIDKTWLALSCRDSSSVRGGSSEVAAAALGSIGGAIFSRTLKPRYFQMTTLCLFEVVMSFLLHMFTPVGSNMMDYVFRLVITNFR